MTDEKKQEILEFLDTYGIGAKMEEAGWIGNLEVDDSPQFEGWVTVRFDFNRGLRQYITRYVEYETGKMTEDATKFELMETFGNTFNMSWDPEDEDDRDLVSVELQKVKVCIAKVKSIVDRQKFLDAMGEEAS